jgi:hypothetical protein
MNRVELSRSVIYGDSMVSGIRLPVRSRRHGSGRALFPPGCVAFNSRVTGCAGMFSASIDTFERKSPQASAKAKRSAFRGGNLHGDR